MKIDFLIFIEHRSRELENACLLKYELEKRGYSVALSNTIFWDSIKTFNKLEPEVIIVPWLYDDADVDFFQSFKKAKSYKIVNLQYEQIYNHKIRVSGSRYPKDTAKFFYHICWGKKTKDYLLKSGMSNESLLLTGSIGLDFNRPGIRQYHLDRSEIANAFSLNVGKKWHLFVSSFGIASTTQQQITDIVKKLDSPEYYEFRESAIQSKKEILNWIERYISKNKEEIFIYRPHPSENRDYRLIELEEMYSNFRVIDEFSVKAWILACDIIHNWYSTSMADIYFLNKNSSVLRPLSIPLELEVEILEGSDLVTNYLEFEYFCQNSEIFNFPIKDDNILAFYDYTDVPTYERISDELENIYFHTDKVEIKKLKNKSQLKRNKWHARVIIYILTEICKRHNISNIVPQSRKRYIQLMEKETYKIEEEIKSIEAKIKSTLG